MAKPKQFVIRKYSENNRISWAVFYRTDLHKAHQGIVLCDQARPLIAGCTKNEAKSYADNLESKNR
jgi:hypothetical protein